MTAKKSIIIEFGEGIDTLRELNIWDDNLTLISELVTYTLKKKLGKNIILLKMQVIFDKYICNLLKLSYPKENELLDLELTIENYLTKYQTIEERKILVEYIENKY